MGEAKVEPFVIDLLPNTKPVFRRQYRYSPKELKFIESAVADMLAQGVIEEARSPWSAPIILAKKEGGKARRVCNDFRGMNEVTVGDNFPLPNVDDCLNILSGGMFFTTLDCHSGYWQVPLSALTKPMTAFQAGNGFYQYKVLPFGLKNAPSAFQRMITGVLAGLLWVDVFVYVDDIVIAGRTLERHLEVLGQVFNRLQNAGLILKPKKCHFMKSKVSVLGFVAGRGGIEPDPAKIEAVANFPVPMNLKRLRGFLGLCNYYRRFIN